MVNLQGFATIPRAVLHDSTIPADAKMVYLVLSSYVGQHDTVWPSHATIAEDAGLSRSTVKRMLIVLRERGLIRWTNHLAPGTECKTINTYELVAATPTPQQTPIAQPEPRSTQTLGSERAIEDSGWLPVDVGSGRATNEQEQLLEIDAVPEVEKNKNKDSPSNERAPTSVTDPRFVEFWAACPRKVGKADAFRKYQLAVRDGTSSSRLLEAMRRYATAMRGKDPQYIAYPATWLHKGRWDDEAPAPEQSFRRASSAGWWNT